jgi:hypothetical protein
MPLGRRGRPGLIGMAARTAVVAGTATAVSGNVQRRQQSRADDNAQNQYEQQQYEQQQQQAQMQAAAQQAVAQQQAAAPAAPAGGVDIVAELQKLAALKDQGILSDAEFAAAKARLLG